MSNIDTLLEGYGRFRTIEYRGHLERWSELAEGQAPKTMMIACSDSRVDPAIIFDAAPGELFVVRNVANLVPPYDPTGGRHGVSAAIEFAVTQLNVEDIVVMGHGGCGGVRAALSGEFKNAKPGEGGFIANWINMLDEPRDKIMRNHGPDMATDLEREGVKMSIAHLRSFPFIHERETRGHLALHGMWFAIANGDLCLLDQQTGLFNQVKATSVQEEIRQAFNRSDL